MSKVKVQSTFTKEKDGGFKVAVWDKDDRHPDGELFIADGEVHSVELTPAVSKALSDGALVEVSGRRSVADDGGQDEPKTATSGAPDKGK